MNLGKLKEERVSLFVKLMELGEERYMRVNQYQ